MAQRKNHVRFFTEDKIKEAWKEIYLSKPLKKRDSSKGVDGVSIKDFKQNEKSYLEEIYRQIKDGIFCYSKLQYYQIIKRGKKPRDIQAPIVKDRIVQKIINDYLIEKYFKNIFSKTNVVGSVKGNSILKNVKQSIDYVNDGYIYILKTDIVKYFPTIELPRLKKILTYYLRGESEIKENIFEYLNISDLPGVPQGPPLSPLMANIYLLKIDKYLTQRKKVKHLRYVDDLMIFCKTKKEAKRIYSYLLKQFGVINLKIHPINSDKTKIGLLSDGEIDILGVIYKDNELKISKKKLIKFYDDVVSPLSSKTNLQHINGGSIRHKTNTLIKILNHKLIGWGGAYSFCNLEKEYEKIDSKIEKNLYKLLSFYFFDKAEQDKIIKKVVKLSNIKLKPIIKTNL